jgi:hypothetical protein
VGPGARASWKCGESLLGIGARGGSPEAAACGGARSAEGGAGEVELSMGRSELGQTSWRGQPGRGTAEGRWRRGVEALDGEDELGTGARGDSWRLTAAWGVLLLGGDAGAQGRRLRNARVSDGAPMKEWRRAAAARRQSEMENGDISFRAGWARWW